MSKPVSCSLYDTLELAFLQKETIKIVLDEGKVEGVPNNLYLNEKLEYLDLSTGAGTKPIRLDSIRELLEEDYHDK